MKPQPTKGKKPKGQLVKTKKAKVEKRKPVKNDSDSEDLILSGSENGDADIQDVEKISSEVSDLLAQLREEHGIEEPTEKLAKKKGESLKTPEPASEATSKKEKKDKKKKEKKPSVEPANVDEPEPVQATDKKSKKKRKLAESEAAATEESAPAKKAKKSKKTANGTESTENAGDETKPAAEDIQAPIKDHHLKGATPVFVANLPLNTKHTQLKTKFQQFGDVLAIHVRTNCGRSFMRKDQLKNIPYLIAFVYFKEREAAEKSLSLNNTEYRGRVIRVDLDTDQKEKVAPKNTIVVGNLKYAVTEEILRKTFECCGELRYIRTLQCDKGCKGIAYVCFENSDSVGLALKLNRTFILDREIRVERYIAKMKKKPNVTSPATSGGKGKKSLKGKKPNAQSKPNATGKKPKDGKKKEFTGVKSATKKTTIKKKKKAMSKEKKLASKIAPKKKVAKSTE